MDKILALENEEQQDEIRFKEIMAHREQILKRNGQIEALQKKIGQLEREIKVEEPKTFQNETEIELLEIEIDAVTKQVRQITQNVLRNEEKLRKSKESFQKLLRAAIEKNKKMLTACENQDAESTDTKTSNANHEAAKRVWALKGQIEAKKLILEYQERKIEEMVDIAQKIGAPFREEQEVGETESSNYDFA